MAEHTRPPTDSATPAIVAEVQRLGRSAYRHWLSLTQRQRLAVVQPGDPDRTIIRNYENPMRSFIEVIEAAAYEVQRDEP